MADVEADTGSPVGLVDEVATEVVERQSRLPLEVADSKLEAGRFYSRYVHLRHADGDRVVVAEVNGAVVDGNDEVDVFVPAIDEICTLETGRYFGADELVTEDVVTSGRRWRVLHDRRP